MKAPGEFKKQRMRHLIEQKQFDAIKRLRDAKTGHGSEPVFFSSPSPDDPDQIIRWKCLPGEEIQDMSYLAILHKRKLYVVNYWTKDGMIVGHGFDVRLNFSQIEILGPVQRVARR